ncbi:MAG: IclR family transcriptional regulator [Thermovirgaceae bacterium]
MSSVDKALEIVTRLSKPPYKMRLTEIAGFLGMSKSAAYQILKSLENYQFVVRDPMTKVYNLGPVLLRLGYVYDQIKGLRHLCLPVMKEVVNQTGLTCYVSVREGIQSFLAYKVDSPDFNSIFYRDIMGSLQSFNCGATGKLLAAHLPAEDIAKLLEKGLEKRTSRSITDKDELLSEYEKIRKRGYATAVRELNENTWGIGVPILGAYKEAVAALGIMGPIDTYSEDQVNRFFLILKDHAKIISEQLRFK